LSLPRTTTLLSALSSAGAAFSSTFFGGAGAALPVCSATKEVKDGISLAPWYLTPSPPFWKLYFYKN